MKKETDKTVFSLLLNRCFFVVLLILLPASIFGLTPIARWDVVPYQRISNSFNIGIVAFSKEGIDRISFSVSGQGYSGSNPVNIYEMKYNVRTEVWEYYFTISPNLFSGDGSFNVNAVVYGGDGDTRVMDSLPLVVNSSGNLSSAKAWVSSSGSDSTGVINEKSAPFGSIPGAISAVQNANSNSADGGIIYLEEGTWYLQNMSMNTSDEWLTIACSETASRSDTVVIGTNATIYTHLLKFDGVTLRSISGGSAYLTTNPDIVWINDCRIIGAGRHVSTSNPLFRHGDEYPSYVTNTEIYDVDYGMHRGVLGRNVIVEKVGNDPFVNVQCLINVQAHDVDPGTTYWHADGYQSWGPPPENRIIYGYYGTNFHYQGLFLREEYLAEYPAGARNNAFVNVFMEMREPGRLARANGEVVLYSGAIYGVWDHLLMWHCSFPTANFYFNNETGSIFSIKNSSFVGNLFYEYRDNITGINNYEDPDYSLPGNNNNNDFLYNHYIWSAVDEGSGGSSEPHWYSKSPDSSYLGTQSTGDPRIASIDPDSGLYGAPLGNSILVDRVPLVLVPIDALGMLRDDTPDIGALESGGSSVDPSLNRKPSGLKLIGGGN